MNLLKHLKLIDFLLFEVVPRHYSRDCFTAHRIQIFTMQVLVPLFCYVLIFNIYMAIRNKGKGQRAYIRKKGAV